MFSSGKKIKRKGKNFLQQSYLQKDQQGLLKK
jgi:hypothetical protein